MDDQQKTILAVAIILICTVIGGVLLLSRENITGQSYAVAQFTGYGGTGPASACYDPQAYGTNQIPCASVPPLPSTSFPNAVISRNPSTIVLTTNGAHQSSANSVTPPQNRFSLPTPFIPSTIIFSPSNPTINTITYTVNGIIVPRNGNANTGSTIPSIIIGGPYITPIIPGSGNGANNPSIPTQPPTISIGTVTISNPGSSGNSGSGNDAGSSGNGQVTISVHTDDPIDGVTLTNITTVNAVAITDIIINATKRINGICTDIPFSTKTINGAGNISANATAKVGFTASNALDRNESTDWVSRENSGKAYIQIKINEAVCIQNMTITVPTYVMTMPLIHINARNQTSNAWQDWGTYASGRFTKNSLSSAMVNELLIGPIWQTVQVPRIINITGNNVTRGVACVEKDSGIDRTVSAIASTLTIGRQDICLNETTSLEFYCDSSGNISNVSIFCPSGCESGACKKIIPPCIVRTTFHEQYDDQTGVMTISFTNASARVMRGDIPTYIDEMSAYTLNTKDASGNTLRRYNMDSGFMVMDQADDIERNEATTFAEIDENADITELSVSDHNGNEIMTVPYDASAYTCEGACIQTDTMGNSTKDICCPGLRSAIVTEEIFTCTACGDGVCQIGETFSCDEDCR